VLHNSDPEEAGLDQDFAAPGESDRNFSARDLRCDADMMSAAILPERELRQSAPPWSAQRVSFLQPAIFRKCPLANVYCTACNQLFSADKASCPRCGMSLPEQERAWRRDTMLVNIDDSVASAISTDVELDSLLLPGQVLEIYQCQKMLGRGGMGVVYLARNTSLHRLCALKLLSPRRVSSEVDYIERFENEGRAAAALVHPNVVTTHAIGRSGDFRYLEMEYVPGSSLQREIDDHGDIGPIRATSMAAGIASGLAMAHRLGIVHRDLKPDNVLVTPGGVPKIADFGLAKRVIGEDLPTSNLAGTPYFMAPELFEGQPASTASDVYALGVCYYLMLTGRFPFEGDSVSSLMKSILTAQYISVRRINEEIPLDIAETVSQMLSRDPSARPEDAGAANQLLLAVLGSTRDLDNLIYDAFHGLPNVQWSRDAGDGFEVRLKFRDERSQTVYVENSEHAAGDRLLMIYSICCEARPDFYEEALRLNAVMHHGGISIRDIGGRPCFVMVDTYPRATVSGEDIRRSAIELGTRADAVEKRLTGRDIN
jgi:eukaryotic-like serine/threonine-protein kinase